MRNEELMGSYASEYHKLRDKAGDCEVVPLLDQRGTLRYSVDIREAYNNGVAPKFLTPNSSSLIKNPPHTRWILLLFINMLF